MIARRMPVVAIGLLTVRTPIGVVVGTRAFNAHPIMAGPFARPEVPPDLIAAMATTCDIKAPVRSAHLIAGPTQHR